ncbi:MAG: tetratricopeptide repeat protein [Verrucomicrobiales bacterium]
MSRAAIFQTVLLCCSIIQLEVKGQNPEPEFDPFSDEAAEALARLSQPEPDSSRDFLEPGQVRALTELAKPSLVTVRQMGRDGEKSGTGSGFIVSEDGLVVTNFHVIGEGRSIEVELSNGKVCEVTEVYASDRNYDLAVVRINTGGELLKPLKVGDSNAIQQGDLIVGFGAPQGLAFSVVPGAISAIRKLEPGFAGEGETPEFPMLQLAMPIEQGNSGGPVINLEGEVLGIVTLRHRVTENLGFAVPGNDLKSLLAKPNPVPISRWRTIGTLDPRQWTPVMGADWSQRAGVITSRHMGEGFGGRALCLSSLKVPETPYEVAVSVKLDDEAGAAGLVFSADGKDSHYGFYPSDGKMRLTRFEGPDVYSWSILEQVEAPSYKQGDWNRLRVRVEASKIIAWVNEEKVFELEDDVLRGGAAGICKFRQTEAEFRGFKVGPDLSEKEMSTQDREVLSGVLDRFSSEGTSSELLLDLGRDSAGSQRVIKDRIGELEKMVAGLKNLETDLYLTTISRELLMALDRPDTEVDLFEVGLQIARLDDPELDLDHYRAVFSQLARDAEAFITKAALEGDAKERAEALRDFMFKENGFHGSRSDYYHHANSYVNHVVDDREGLPITLSVVFIELARRLGINDVFGAALPGKFMVGLSYAVGDKKEKVFFDVFDEGKTLSRDDAIKATLELTGESPENEAFEPSGARDIAVRMLRNLVDIEINRKRTPEQAENYLELLLAIQPDSAYERFQRAILRVQASQLDGAREDLDWLLENRPPGLDYSRLQQFRESLPEE